MTPETSSRMRWIGLGLIFLSGVAMLVAGSWFTATEKLPAALHAIGAVCFGLWWSPGLVGAVILFLSRRP